MFTSVCADFEAELVEFDSEDDHVHLLVNYPPKVAVSALVNSLKGVSSRMIRQKNHPSIRKKLWGGALSKGKDGYAVRAILPRPEGRGLSRTRSNGHFAI